MDTTRYEFSPTYAETVGVADAILAAQITGSGGSSSSDSSSEEVTAPVPTAKRKRKPKAAAAAAAAAEADETPSIPASDAAPNSLDTGIVDFTMQRTFGDRRDETGYKNYVGLGDVSAAVREMPASWRERSIPIEDAFRELADAAGLKRDAFVPVSALRWQKNSLGYLQFTDGHGFTNWGMNSAWDWAGGKQGTLADLRDPKWGGQFNGAIAEMFNALVANIRNGAEKQAMLRYRIIPGETGDREAVRAVRPSTFVAIDNEQVLATLVRAIPHEGRDKAVLTYFSHDGDNMAGDIILPDMVQAREDSEYGVGVSFANSEVGSSAVRIEPYLFRLTCANGMVYSTKGMNEDAGVLVVPHRGVFDYDLFQERVNRAVAQALATGGIVLRQMDDSRDVEFSDTEAVAVHMAAEHGLTVGQTRAWWAGYAQTVAEEASVAPVENTLFGLVNGMTRAAQNLFGFERQSMERLAGTILSDDLAGGKKAMWGRYKQVESAASALSATKVSRLLYGQVYADESAPELTMAEVLAATASTA